MSAAPERSAQVDAYALALERFSLAAAALPQDPSPVTGQWGLRELLLHLAAWHEEGARRIPELLDGAPDRAYDADAFNAAALAAAREQDVGAAWQRYGRAVRAFAGAVAAASESAFAPGAPAAQWVAAQTGHLRAHTDQLRRPGRR